MTTTTLADAEARFLHEYARMIKDSNKTDTDPLQEAIAKVAYFKAEQRGFEPGHELPDWLAAEEEIRSTIALAQSRQTAHRSVA